MRIRSTPLVLALVAAAVAAMGGAATSEKGPVTPAERVRAAGEMVQSYNLEHSIAPRLRLGLPIDELPDVTPAAAARDAAFFRKLLLSLRDLEDTDLGPDNADSLAVLRHLGNDAIEGERFAGLMTPVTPYSSPLRSVLQAFSLHPLKSAEDRRHYLALLDRAATWIGTFESGLREQAKRGIVLAAPEVPLAAGPFAAALQNGDASPFAVAEARLAALPAKDRHELREAVARTIDTRVNPALASLGAYLAGDYAKAAPPGVGLGQYPGGADYYRFLVKYHTTQNVDPEQIHRIGLAEMERIAEELEGVRLIVGFASTLAEFRKFLRNDARFFPASAEAIGAKLMANQQRILARVPEFFGRTPKAPSGVERLAPALEGSMTFGYYDPPNPSRDKGLYYYNGSKPGQRSMLTSAALIAHELVPGHHFQIALQQENKALPAFRQDYFTTAFVEGWGEYASDFAQRMGMYNDPYDMAGRLMMDAHLSARLVVDTGMNALGWSREKASQYLAENTLLSDAEIATETLRYACDLPGQALAYKMGMRAIVDERERARRELGDKFDLRAFHDVVLGAGAVPMDVLRQRVDRWLSATRRAAK